MLLVLTLIVVSCTDDFDEINTDPNNPTSVPAENLFTQAQFSLVDEMWGRALNFEYAMLMVQHFAQVEYAEDSRYNQSNSTFNTPWVTLFAGNQDTQSDGGLANVQEAMELTMEDPNINEAQRNNRLAQLGIMRAWTFQIITDVWGDVPYSEALQPNEFPFPAYDPQENIYSGLLAELDEALGRISTSESGFASGDVLFGGDMASWGRFGNSLKLRMGMRISDVDATLASTVVSEAMSSSLGLIGNNEQNAVFVFNSDQRLANPFYVDNVINNRDDFAVSEILISRMESANDPRLSAYALRNTNDEFVGMPYGLTDADAFALNTVTSRPNGSIREATAPATLLSYAEVEFLRAEAIQRNFTTGDASQSYANAIEASMKQWGISDQSAIDSYLAAHPYDAANFKESIGYEKWIALYTQGVEAWAERRRLDAPSLPVPEAAVLDMIPVRAFYPAVEQEANATNLDAVGFNNQTTKVWWDVF